MTEAPGPRLRVAVLVSGRGSNLAALIAAQEARNVPVDIVLVASDRADAPALRLAEAHNIATLSLDPQVYAHRRDFDADLLARAHDHGARVLVLAGFMRILDADVIAPWRGRIINIHPSLLPRYRGLHTHRQVLAAGDREHGASVHFVGGELDGGPVIAQARMDVRAGDDEHSLASRLLTLEHRLLPAALALIAHGRIDLDGERVRLDGVGLEKPLLLQGAQLHRG